MSPEQSPRANMSPEQSPNNTEVTPEISPIEAAAKRGKEFVDSQIYEVLTPVTIERLKNIFDEVVLLAQDGEQPNVKQHENLESLVASLGLNNKDETPDAISTNPQPQTPNDTVDKIG